MTNAPRHLSDYAHNTLFSSFSGRSPKTLDPQVSYSSDESVYTYLIYEPLYGYHYLKRPYSIIPRAAERVVEPEFLDAQGNVLAADAPRASVAYSRYTIPIRKGVRFAPHPAFAMEDGRYLYHAMDSQSAGALRSPLDLPRKGTRELTAGDFAYGIRRLADPRLASPVLSLMQEYVVGLRETAQRLDARDRRLREKGQRIQWRDVWNETVRGIEVLDAHTLRITIHGTYPQFLNWLSMTFFAPVPWEAEAFYANPGLAQNNVRLAAWPVGTGPYYLAVSRTNREHVLERNPNYRLDPYPCEGEREDEAKGFLRDCGKPTPFADRIVMTMEKESLPASSKFLQGYYDSPQITRLDVGQGFLTAAMDNPEKAALYEKKKLQFPTSVEANLWYIGFNWLDPVVGAGSTPEQAERNRKLRQALSIAIDWEEQIAIFEKGQGKAAAGPLPPGLFGYREDGAAGFNPVVYRRDAQGRVVRRTIEEAKALLAAAGYPDGRDAVTGKPLVLNFDWQGGSAGSKAFLEWFSRQFSKLGIQLEIRATDYNRFQDKMQRGVAQIYYWGWLADYPDAENFLFLLYGPNSKVGGKGGENASNYRNSAYDALFEEMKTLSDSPRKAQIIERMISIVQQDAPWSFGYYPTSAAALHEWIGNAKPTQIIRNNLQYMSVNARLRAERIREWNEPVLWPALLAGLVLLAFGVGIVRIVRRRGGETVKPGERS